MDGIIDSFLSKSSEETFLFGKDFAKNLKENSVVALIGDLGAGKTTFVKGLLASIAPSIQAVSPTFTYLNIYKEKMPIYHFDLYRIPTKEAFIGMGFEEYLSDNGISIIEWAEKVLPLLPKNTLVIDIKYQGENDRLITVSSICGKK